jgi:hypothetical protein
LSARTRWSLDKERAGADATICGASTPRKTICAGFGGGSSEKSTLNSAAGASLLKNGFTSENLSEKRNKGAAP